MRNRRIFSADATSALDGMFPATSWRNRVDDDPVGALWRGAQIFRLLGFLYALGFNITINDELSRPAVAWVLFTLLTGTNLLLAAGYLLGPGRRWWCIGAEFAVFIAAMLSTFLVADADWIANNQTWPTTLWCASALLSAAVLGGTWAGAAAGVLIGAVNFVVKGEVFMNLGNPTFLLLVVAGMALGLAASRARINHAQLSVAMRVATQAQERDRLARHVHDGVLQTLALISRRGQEIGGPTAELAELAATQERQLRRLIAETPAEPAVPPSGSLDLGPALRALAADSVSVSTPADPVVVGALTGEELLAAVHNILDNTRFHAGPDARSFVLLEDLDDEVVVSVRDDGCGIAPGRLEEAAAQGRMGITQAIIGRVESLGGSVSLKSAPGAGTEWELTAPADGPGPTA
ncbi:MacS family sensor histidine kinase [Gordonia phosphorivorans]|uniref:MacS family sensor histidine kinase n=1 Tax=Gordonia phosphorivorans TaxID=1056982 RepID=A0ABV6H887_9ACTN